MFKKLFLVAAVAIGLAGCAELQAIQTGLSLATKSVSNPVTKSDEAKIELALDTAVVALKTYKSACAAGTADKHCRDNVAQIQVYTRSARPLIAQLRNFVDANDQVNATVVYNQLVALYGNAKAIAAAAGVNLGDIQK